MEYTFHNPIHDETDLLSPAVHPTNSLELDPTLNNALSAAMDGHLRAPTYGWSTSLDRTGHPTTLFVRDGRPIARIVWMGSQFKEFARSVSSAKSVPRSPAQAFDIVTAPRCSTLKLGDQPTVGLDDFLMKCGTFTRRRSRKFATNSQLFTWLDENGADLTLIAGESSTSERIAILNEQSGTLRVGSLGMRMLHMDVLIITSVVMLHRRWQRFHH